MHQRALPWKSHQAFAAKPLISCKSCVCRSTAIEREATTDTAQQKAPASVELAALPDTSSKQQSSSPLFELTKQQSFWVLNLVALLYGSNTTGVKHLLEQSHLAPSIISALRFDIAALALLPLLLRPGLSKCNWLLTAELGAYLALGYGLQAQELATASASEGSVMLAVFLVLVPVIELFHGRSLTLKKVLALALAVVGVALLSAGGDAEAVASEAHRTILGIPEGPFWGFLSSTAFAVHLVRSEVRQHEAKDLGQLAAGQLLVCAVLIDLWAGGDIGSHASLAAQANPATLLQAVPWGAMIVTSLMCTAGCQTGELVAVGKIPSSTASLTLSMLVVWGLFEGVLINHDVLGPTSWLGAALIVGAGIVPKFMDVLADRAAASGAEQLKEVKPQPELPPLSLSGIEVARTVAATGMLLEAGGAALAGASLGAPGATAAVAAGGAAAVTGMVAAAGGTTAAGGAAAAGAVAAATAGAVAASSATAAAAGGTVAGAGGAAAAGVGAAVGAGLAAAGSAGAGLSTAGVATAGGALAAAGSAAALGVAAATGVVAAGSATVGDAVGAALAGVGIAPEIAAGAASSISGIVEAAAAAGNAVIEAAGVAGGTIEAAGTAMAPTLEAMGPTLEAAATQAAGTAAEAGSTLSSLL